MLRYTHYENVFQTGYVSHVSIQNWANLKIAKRLVKENTAFLTSLFIPVLEQLPPRKTDPNPNPNPNHGAIFLGGNCPDTVYITMLYYMHRFLYPKLSLFVWNTPKQALTNSWRLNLNNSIFDVFLWRNMFTNFFRQYKEIF